MSNHHGACCGPLGAANIHRGCPVVWVGANGRQMTCGCSCHANEVEGIALQTRGNGVPSWENKTSPQVRETPTGSDHLPELAERGCASW